MFDRTRPRLCPRAASLVQRWLCEPRYRCLRNIEAPSDVRLYFAICEALNSFLPLVRCQRSWTSEFYAIGLRTFAALACPGTDKLALELGQATEYREHQPAVWR